MREFSVFEAKNKLSELIRLVNRSGVVPITNRGEPVAQLVPFQKASTAGARLEKLEKSGRIERKGGSESSFWRPAKKIPNAVKEFLKDRD
jgi:prevent-host-death family protein